MRKHIIKIYRCSDYYNNFYKEYIVNTILEKQYHGNTFFFNIFFDKDEEMDEQLLFEYYLIASKYGEYALFDLRCHLSQNRSSGMENYYRLSTYGYIQQNIDHVLGKVEFSDGFVQRMQTTELKGISRLVPVFRVTQENLKVLTSPIDENAWNNIKSGTAPLKTFENIIYRLCWSFLFRPVGRDNATLSNLRKEAFLLDEFYECIKDVPILALLIFAILDYTFREEAVVAYKNEIKSICNIDQVQIRKEDLIYEFQNLQNYGHYKAYRKICKKYDNKTIVTGRVESEYQLHTYIIRELYEAITISEGILQLFDNIVKHAGNNENGVGVASLYIRSYTNDKAILEKKYKDFFMDHNGEEKSKYYLEMIIADLSGTSIPDKFNGNLPSSEHWEEIVQKVPTSLQKKETISPFNLKDFFAPTTVMKKFWEIYFSFPDQAINHYGLQIFDSIINSKRGLFEVKSGEEKYSNLHRNDYQDINSLGGVSVSGTKFTIFCPLNGVNTIDNNIYDSMFEYEYNDIVKENIEWDETKIVSDRNYTIQVNELLKEKHWDNNSILCVNVSNIVNLEEFVKGMLMYIFEYKEANRQIPLLAGFLHCKPHEIINIVRVMSIYYDKQGENIKMEGVQIYLRGDNIGEEILFYGKNLHEVRKNIAKSSCMRGIMFDNLQTVNNILERESAE